MNPHPHTVAISAREAILNKKVRGLARGLLPARTLLTIGMRMRINAVGKSHNTPNKRRRPGTFCFVRVLLTDSRIANGSTRTKLMSAAILKFLNMLFMGYGPNL